eukprot:6483177-Pyramimonas_sp.AAC.1
MLVRVSTPARRDAERLRGQDGPGVRPPLLAGARAEQQVATPVHRGRSGSRRLPEADAQDSQQEFRRVPGSAPRHSRDGYAAE